MPPSDLLNARGRLFIYRLAAACFGSNEACARNRNVSRKLAERWKFPSFGRKLETELSLFLRHASTRSVSESALAILLAISSNPVIDEKKKE